MRLATYNIRNGRAVGPATCWWRRRRALGEVITQVNADVWALQETYRFQRRYLQRRTLPPSSWGSAGEGRNEGGGGEQVPVFYRHAMFAVESATTRWFGPTPEIAGSVIDGASRPRISTAVSLQCRDDGRPLRVVSLHLDSDSAERRTESIRQLADWLGADIPAVPTVVMGDFNGPMTDPGFEALAEQGLTSALGPDGGPTSNGFGRDPESQRQIDHIFVSSDLEVVSAEIVRWAGHASDHYPVVADVRWSDR